MKRLYLNLIFLIILLPFFGCQKRPESNIYTFRYSNSQPKQHPRSQSMIFFKKELEKRTNGIIIVENYFSAVLGTEFEVLDMVATGALQGTRSGAFTNVNKKYSIFMLPFLIDGWDEAMKLLSSDFTKKINKLGISTSKELADYLLENYRIALLPASDFYFNQNELFFRLAFVDFDGDMVYKQYLKNGNININFIKK